MNQSGYSNKHTKVESRPFNNFDFLRLFAASIVVFSHSFALTGKKDPLEILNNGQMHFGALGVFIFFIISGNLITQSLFRSKSYWEYFAKRSLRIFPALVLDILLAIFLFGTLLTTLPLTDYFSHPLTHQYLGNLSLYRLSFELPGVFDKNPVKAVNGSLWTLSYEFTCYIGIVIIYWIGLAKRRHLFALSAFTLYLTWIILHEYLIARSVPVLNLSLLYLIPLVLYFSGGALLFLYEDKIKFDPRLASLLSVVLAVSFYFGIGLYFSLILLPYIIISFAFAPLSFLQIGKDGDFSYGVYIYSFSIQQVIVSVLGIQISIFLMLILSFLFTIPFAMLSWFVVEKRALTIKKILF